MNSVLSRHTVPTPAHLQPWAVYMNQHQNETAWQIFIGLIGTIGGLSGVWAAVRFAGRIVAVGVNTERAIIASHERLASTQLVEMDDFRAQLIELRARLVDERALRMSAAEEHGKEVTDLRTQLNESRTERKAQVAALQAEVDALQSELAGERLVTTALTKELASVRRLAITANSHTNKADDTRH